MPIDQRLAHQAIARLAGRLGLDVMATAQGIIAVVTANMARAIRVISVQRGYDPRDYTLVAFGGAGPLHVARLARELDIARVLAPRNPGILCATGLLLTDLRADFASTRLLTLEDASLPALTEAFSALDARAQTWFADEGVPDADRLTLRTVDVRYAGQNYELPVPLPPGPLSQATLQGLASGFEEAHRRLYGFAVDNAAIQLVTTRVEAAGIVRKAAFAAHEDAGPDGRGAVVGTRDVWLPEAGRLVPCPVYDRERLRPGNLIAGTLRPGDVVEIVTPGAGGYGAPASRDIALVRRDLREGRIDAAMARLAYDFDE